MRVRFAGSHVPVDRRQRTSEPSRGYSIGRGTKNPVAWGSGRALGAVCWCGRALEGSQRRIGTLPSTIASVATAVGGTRATNVSKNAGPGKLAQGREGIGL